MACECGHRDLCKCCSGACCQGDGVVCLETSCVECEALGYKFQGVGTKCRETPESLTVFGDQLDHYCPCLSFDEGLGHYVPADPDLCQKCNAGSIQTKCQEGELCCGCKCQECCTTDDCGEGECCVNGTCVATPCVTAYVASCTWDPIFGDTLSTATTNKAVFGVLDLRWDYYNNNCQWFNVLDENTRRIWMVLNYTPIEVQEYGGTPTYPIPEVAAVAPGKCRYVWRAFTGTGAYGSPAWDYGSATFTPPDTATPYACDNDGTLSVAAWLLYLDTDRCVPEGGIATAVLDSSYDLSSWPTNDPNTTYPDNSVANPPCYCEGYGEYDNPAPTLTVTFSP